MKYVMQYETNPEKLPLAREHYPAHRARLDAFHAKGTLLMAGPFENPMEGAVAIFTTREAAEEFIREDPFVLSGLVKSHSVRGWNEALA
jgi:uncharacterized protein